MLTEQENAFIIKAMPNHIRPVEGGKWIFDPGGVVWYDPYGCRDTFDEAWAKMVEIWSSYPPACQKSKLSDAEIANQRLKVENEDLRLQLMTAQALVSK